LTSETYESIFGHLVGLLGWRISLSQGHCLHRTAQHRKLQTHIHAHDPSVWADEDCMCLRQCSHWDWHVYILLHSYCQTSYV